MARKPLTHRKPDRGSLCLLAFVGLMVVATTFAPRNGSALAVFAISPARYGPILEWSAAHGARLTGTTAIGGLVLDHAPEGAFLTALSEGAIAIAVPLALCDAPLKDW